MRELWHYTLGHASKWGKIERDGVIRLATANNQPGERPVVWCTYADPWEPAASKLPLFTTMGRVADLWALEEHARRAGSVIRIGVRPEAAPLTWDEWVRQGAGGISERELRWMLKQADKIGSDVRLYRISFEPIPRNLWTRVEVWRDARTGWVDYRAPSKRAGGLLSRLFPGAVQPES